MGNSEWWSLAVGLISAYFITPLLSSGCRCSGQVEGRGVLCDLVIREKTSYNLISNKFIDSLPFIYTSYRNNQQGMIKHGLYDQILLVIWIYEPLIPDIKLMDQMNQEPIHYFCNNSVRNLILLLSESKNLAIHQMGIKCYKKRTFSLFHINEPSPPIFVQICYIVPWWSVCYFCFLFAKRQLMYLYLFHPHPSPLCSPDPRS